MLRELIVLYNLQVFQLVFQVLTIFKERLDEFLSIIHLLKQTVFYVAHRKWN